MFGVSLGKQKSQWWHWWGHGAFGPPPVGGPAPTYPSYKNKNGKNQPILAFYIFAPSPQPPSQQKIIWCSHCAISNLVLRLVKIFSGVKIHAIWQLRLVKIFTWVKYKWLDKIQIGLQRSLGFTTPPPSHFDGLPYSQVRWYPQLFSSKWPQGCKRDYLGALGHFL